MNREQIKAVINAAGYTPLISDKVSKSGNGTMRSYVRARYKRGKWQWIGKLLDIEKLSEAELTALLADKFSEKEAT